MPMSNNSGAFTDCYEFMDQALDSEKGIRVKLESLRACEFFRARCNQARALSRRENGKLYPHPEQPLHFKSVYDQLTFVIKPVNGEFWVYITQRPSTVLAVEEIPDGPTGEID